MDFFDHSGLAVHVPKFAQSPNAFGLTISKRYLNCLKVMFEIQTKRGHLLTPVIGDWILALGDFTGEVILRFFLDMF